MNSSLVPLKIRLVEGLMLAKYVEAQSPPFDLGCGSQVVKVTVSWPACHEFEPSAAEDPMSRGAMHVKSVEAQTSSRCCGSYERDGPAQVSSSSLDNSSK
ncbi:hypothetical protein TNCV_3661931 [Trichonephila clavipes]|nr:hypothetical protein TNCV_3661931 [Trichonephila clavipes]